MALFNIGYKAAVSAFEDLTMFEIIQVVVVVATMSLNVSLEPHGYDAHSLERPERDPAPADPAPLRHPSPATAGRHPHHGRAPHARRPPGGISLPYKSAFYPQKSVCVPIYTTYIM
jgi:hypothetical protein